MSNKLANMALDMCYTRMNEIKQNKNDDIQTKNKQLDNNEPDDEQTNDKPPNNILKKMRIINVINVAIE